MLVGGLILVLAAAVFYYYQFYDRPSGEEQSARQEEPVLIDLDRTVALLDMFDHTHVSVFLREGVAGEVVAVDGNPLTYDYVEERWAGTYTGYRAGESIALLVITTDDRSEEVSLKVQALSLD